MEETLTDLHRALTSNFIQHLWDKLEHRPCCPTFVPDLINAKKNPCSQVPKSCGEPTYLFVTVYVHVVQYVNVCILQQEPIHQVSSGFTGCQMLSLWDSRVQQSVLVKVLLAVYVSAGTVNRGPGIYNTSLPSHHKTLMFINVNARDLYLNVIFMSQLKGVLMRRDGEEGGGGKSDGQTDGDVR